MMQIQWMSPRPFKYKVNTLKEIWVHLCPTRQCKGKLFSFMKSQLPLKKSPMTQKVLNFLARSLVLAIGLGNMLLQRRKWSNHQPGSCIERGPQRAHRADEEGLRSLTQWEQIFLTCKYRSIILCPSWPQGTSWKNCHFSMKSYELQWPQSHQLCSPYFGRAYRELTSSYVQYVIPEMIDHFPH